VGWWEEQTEDFEERIRPSWSKASPPNSEDLEWVDKVLSV